MAHIFLDLDGTLTDPKVGITQSVIHALTTLGHPAPPADDITWVIGPPLWDSFRTLGVPEAQLDDAVAAYRARYTDIGLFEAHVYPGVLDMLASLKDVGHIMHLATSKPHSYARKITAHYGIAPFLTHEFGSELDGSHSNKVDLLAHGLKVSGADPKASFMIGDRKYDAEGANAHGLTMIGALWGYGGAEELTAEGVDILAANPAEIPGLIHG